MAHADCVAFLQEALPRLGIRWQGFRKVHGHGGKRLRRRMNELGIEGFAAYRKRLDTHPEEWAGARWIDPSSPSRASSATRASSKHSSATCCPTSRPAREAEAASAVLVCRMCLGRRTLYAQVPLGSRGGARLSRRGTWVAATDIDETAPKRARKGCYSGGSLRELP